MSELVNQYWQLLSDFIKYRNSTDIGVLNHLALTIVRKTPQEHIFNAQIISFLQSISSHAKNNPHQYSEALALMSLDALIYNIYKIVKGNEEFKPNSSSFYGWMSTSQLSGDVSELSNQCNQKQPKKIVNLIQSLSNSEQLFKRIKLILDRSNNKQHNQRYGQNLIQTIDYIINKQKCNKQNFKKLKAKYISNSITVNKNKGIDYKTINQIIFSNHINKIVKILTQGEDELHLALIRIYMAASSNIDRKQFQGNKYSAQDILYNLYRFYIENFDDKNQLFQQSKNPIYRMLKNMLVQLFVPFFNHFHTIVSIICQKGDEQNAFNFYKNNASSIERQLISFVNLIPQELIKILNTLYVLIDKFYKNNSQSSLTPIKKFIFYSFLLSQNIIDDLMPHLDPLKYSHSYNHILLLFFQNSIKKYSHYNQSQITFITHLIDTISNALDQRILSPEVRILNQDQQQTLQFQFTITQPILNHDYQMISQILDKIQFTPKDNKAFIMKQEHQLHIQSPIYKPFRKQTQFITPIDLLKDEDIDLVTWMSVGGNRDWNKVQQTQIKGQSRVKQRLSKLQTLKGARIHQLQKLKGQFQYYL